jgi:hypothetical protein
MFPDSLSGNTTLEKYSRVIFQLKKHTRAVFLFYHDFFALSKPSALPLENWIRIPRYFRTNFMNFESKTEYSISYLKERYY